MITLEPMVQDERFSEALDTLAAQEREINKVKHAKPVLDKLKANLLLSSHTAAAQDFRPLIAGGVLNASPAPADPRAPFERLRLPPALCVREITKEAAEALSSSGIRCLDLRDNLHLCTLPVEALCLSLIHI